MAKGTVQFRARNGKASHGRPKTMKEVNRDRNKRGAKRKPR